MDSPAPGRASHPGARCVRQSRQGIVWPVVYNAPQTWRHSWLDGRDRHFHIRTTNSRKADALRAFSEQPLALQDRLHRADEVIRAILRVGAADGRYVVARLVEPVSERE